MTLSWQDEMEERKRILREQNKPSTYHGRTEAELEVPGRFAEQSKATVIGKDGAPNYPAAAQWSMTELPPEPPFGVQLHSFDIPLHSVVQEKKK